MQQNLLNLIQVMEVIEKCCSSDFI